MQHQNIYTKSKNGYMEMRDFYFFVAVKKHPVHLYHPLLVSQEILIRNFFNVLIYIINC